MKKVLARKLVLRANDVFNEAEHIQKNIKKY